MDAGLNKYENHLIITINLYSAACLHPFKATKIVLKHEVVTIASYCS